MNKRLIIGLLPGTLLLPKIAYLQETVDTDKKSAAIEVTEIIGTTLVETNVTLHEHEGLFYKFLGLVPSFLGPLAVIMILWGGLKMIVSCGKEEKIGSVWKGIFNAIIGVILLVFFVIWAISFWGEKGRITL